MFTHTELCSIGERYLRNMLGCKVTAKEIKTWTQEVPDVIGFKADYSYLIEAKASISDFIADKKKPFRTDPQKGMGDYRYFICEENLIKTEDLPTKWGLIYVNKKGKARLIIGNKKNCYGKKWQFEKDKKEEFYFLYSLVYRISYLKIVRKGEWGYEDIAKFNGINIKEIK